MIRLLVPFVALLVGACAQTPSSPSAPAPAEAVGASERLTRVLAAQPADTKARYAYRNPQQTLEYFGIEPGMTVIEALPGGGWYSRILIDYLGREGELVGADYAFSMWPRFGFFSAEAIEAKKTWTQDWTADAEKWRGDDSAAVSAFVFGSMPAAMAGKADAVLFIRAMHNLSRFEKDGGYLTAAIDDAWRALKPGGIVGVVQHHARDNMPDEWADGSRGYVKRQMIVDNMQARGFEFIGESAINANPRDLPTENDIVWRLQPTYVTSRDNPELKAKLALIGESNRMTLKFRKPSR